jgi:hypothetical protein
MSARASFYQAAIRSFIAFGGLVLWPNLGLCQNDQRP